MRSVELCLRTLGSARPASRGARPAHVLCVQEVMARLQSLFSAKRITFDEPQA